MFADKVRRGITPTNEDWEIHLIEAHCKEPSMSPDAFAGFRTEDGHNSYEVLAQGLRNQKQNLEVIDLACGDGHLIPKLLEQLGSKAKIYGVDMAPEGLEIARQQIRDPRVSFYQARAQQLPFLDGSIDHIFCHMAFMLMLPIDEVVDEIRRVLKPGGRFHAVIGGGTSVGLYVEIQRMVGLFMQAHLPHYSKARVGSAGARNREGMQDLFEKGFEPSIRSTLFQLRYYVPPVGIIEYLKNMYFIPIMPEEGRRELEDELMALARDHTDRDGKVLFYVPMQLFEVRRSEFAV